MMSSSTKKPQPEKSATALEPGWFDRETMARIFDLKNATSFDRRYGKLGGDSARKIIGGRVYYHARKTIDAFAVESTRTIKASVQTDFETDPLFAGADSPALERWREARASIAECELAERRGDLVRLATVRHLVNSIGGPFRITGTRLAQVYGNDASEMLNCAVVAVEEAARRWLNGLPELPPEPDAAGTSKSR